MELEELIKVVHGKLLNDYKKTEITGFSTDTRTINNEVFIALKGDRFNGHQFINNTIDASVVISEEDIKLDSIPVIKVKSNYDTLYYLCKYFISKYNIPVIAITGSNGKTTLKELIAQILSLKYKVLKNNGNQNNIVGLFNTVKKLDDSYDLCVLEMGMNHLGEISRLSIMTNPTTAIITNIGSAHIGNFKKKKDIFKAKMEITDGLKGDLIVNGDDKYLKRTNAFKCGIKCNNDLMAYNIKIYPNLLSFDIYLDHEYNVQFNVPSNEYIPEILEAIKIGLEYKIDNNEMINVIKSFNSINHRLNYKRIHNYTLIDDCYNASYESVKCGLEILRNISNHKVIILGDMLELGKYSKKYHKKINRLLRKIDNKTVLTIGYYTKYINSLHFDNINAIINYLQDFDLTDNYIYIKGSRRMHLDDIVRLLESKYNN